MEKKIAWEKFKEKNCSRINHLIVFCHPNERSLSAAYRDEILQFTEDTGNNGLVRNLYGLGFHPVLSAEDLRAIDRGDIPDDIRIEQDYIRGADLITLIYPIWWTGMPALMKGYIDRVFSKGFAYEITSCGEVQGLLTGKKVLILNNFGQTYNYYEQIGMLSALKKTSDEGIFNFCGMEVVGHHFFGHLDQASKEERAAHIKTLSFLYEKFLPPYE